MTATIDAEHQMPAMEHPSGMRFLWLDLTRECQLACGHCYNDSGPGGGHGNMSRDRWLSVLDQAIRADISKVRMIGGEPTMHPNFAELLTHALAIGLKVEVFSNLVRVKPEWWELFTRPGVTLATSYYSDDPDEHNGVTGRDSHRKTRANIARARELGIPLRAGVIATRTDQRVTAAASDLAALGVDSVGSDRVRRFGRGQGDHTACDVAELCGRCGDGRASIGPNGEVTPCIMAAWLTAGNVQDDPLADILTGGAMAAAVASIPKAANPCDPGCSCQPDAYPCYPSNE